MVLLTQTLQYQHVSTHTDPHYTTLPLRTTPTETRGPGILHFSGRTRPEAEYQATTYRIHHLLRHLRPTHAVLAGDWNLRLPSSWGSLPAMASYAGPASNTESTESRAQHAFDLLEAIDSRLDVHPAADHTTT